MRTEKPDPLIASPDILWGTMGRSLAPRIAMYSHDTFGLGHITRTIRLARTIVETISGATVLVLTGSPVAHRLTFPPGVEFVKLPSVRKRGPEDYVARDLGISFRRLRQMRTRIIRDMLRLLEPDLLFVDNVPLGMKGEILPALEELKGAGGVLHLNLRDILDDPLMIRGTWEENDTYGALESLYDEIHVFGDRSVYDAVELYGLPRGKTRFHGYIAPQPAANAPSAASAERSVLVTIGGGEDGIDIIRCVLGLARARGRSLGVRFDVVLGPLMDARESELLREALLAQSNVRVRDFVEDLADRIPGYDAVISMGGYNTLCEVMARARRSVVIPRIYPRREQEIRACSLEARGIVRVLHPSACTPESLSVALADSLDHGPLLPAAGTPDLGGLMRFQERLVELFGSGDTDALQRGGPARRVSATRAIGRKPRRVVRTGALGFAFTLLAGAGAALFGGVGAAAAHIVPQSMNAEVLVGYDSNILDASDAETRAFETQDPAAYFVIEHMDDAVAQLTVDGRWSLAPGRKTDMRLRYTRLQYVREDIRSENHYSVLWRSRPMSGIQAALGIEFAPNVYARHRRDKDALPGDPLFRPEVRDEWDATLQVVRELNPTFSSQFILEGSLRDYVNVFDERDRWRVGARTGFLWSTSENARLDLSAGYRRLGSRNDPYLGSDLSYRSWMLRSAFDWAAFGSFLRLRAYLNHDWRTYTSSDPDDQSHYGRHDRVWELGGAALHSFSPSLDWKASVTHMRRSASSAFDINGELDEQGSVRDTFVSTGFAWHWKR